MPFIVPRPSIQSTDFPCRQAVHPISHIRNAMENTQISANIDTYKFLTKNTFF